MALKAKDLKPGMIIEYYCFSPGNRFEIISVIVGSVRDKCLKDIPGYGIGAVTSGSCAWMDAVGFKVIKGLERRTISWI